MNGYTTAVSLVLMVLTTAAQAGMVVTDPTSYSYYVEQLKKQAELIESATKQVETMGGVLDTANSIESKLMGHYNRATGIVNRITKLQKVLNRDNDGNLFATLKQIGDAGRATGGVLRGSADELNATGKDYGSLTGNDLFVDTQKVLDWNFGDPRDKSDPMAQYRNADSKYQSQQGALKGVIANSEALLGGVKDRIDGLKDLAQQANSTANMKDAQDMTNAILIEILKTLTDFLAIAAQANQANALLNFSGATDQTMADRQKALSGIGKTVKESQLQLTLKTGASSPEKLQTRF
jgi:conjugal transfer/entry exclusion protein